MRSALLAACAAFAFAQEAPPPAAPAAESITLGRAKLQQIRVAQKQAQVRSVDLRNKTKAAAMVTRIETEGDGLSVAVKKLDQRFAVEAGKPFSIELPAESEVMLELKIDAKDAELGEQKGKVTIDVGGLTLALPVEWEVVEAAKADDDLPPPRPESDWKKWATEGPQPRFACYPYSHDFEKVLSGETVKTTFTLKNEGEGDLVIIQVKPQCHCTASRLILPDRTVETRELRSKEGYGKLKPGEEATLEIGIDTAGMGGLTHKKVHVYTNDRVHSPISLDLVLLVDNPFQFSPASATFGNVRSTEVVERVVRMSSIDQGKFTIVGHELPDPPVMDVEYRQVPTRRNEQCAWELVLKSKTGLPAKEHLGKLKLVLEHERIKELDQLHYSLRIVPDVEWRLDKRVSPESVTLGVVRPGVNDVKTFTFENKNPALPWKLTGATVTSRIGTEPFAVEWKTIEEGQKYEVTLKVVDAPKIKSFNGELEITAESATVPLLKIKFSGIWAGQPKGQ